MRKMSNAIIGVGYWYQKQILSRGVLMYSSSGTTEILGCYIKFSKEVNR